MPDIDNKVVSISFNNKQFMRDVADTISVIEELNEATSGKKIDSSGIENLGRAFRSTTSDLTKQADSVVSAFSNIQSAANTNFQTAGIDSLRKALESTGMTATDVEDTISSLQQLSRTGLSYASDLGVSSAAQQIQNESANTRSILTQDIDDVSNSFSALEMIGIGAMIAIGEKAAEVGANALRSLTSGIRDGWGEYNALTNSTQTILVNTQRWGSTMEDVSGALEELNRYADMTTYSFSDMTRNIGYFTTAGVQLEDSVTAIRGLSNVGAMFGADAQSVARAGYQISQAMSAGVIKLMDWRSMINAGMGGQALQDELIRTAAVMSGTSVDAMNEYIDSLGGFNASLQEGWLTSDVFLEAMRVFAGQSREYYRSLTDANGERLYSDEEIDRLVKLGETAMESATQVRTLQQMIDAFKESIGSGWQRTFTLIIGNLEEAKEFWTPINNILTSLVDGFFDLQTGALSLWRTLGGREQLLEGINNVLTSLSNNLGAIGRAFMNAFGNSTTMGARLMGITEALTDLSESLILSEEELGFLEDFFTGIFEPISLVVDVIFELVKALFDADDSVLNLEHSADGLYSGFTQFRHALLAILGYIGSVLKTGANFIKQSRIIRTVIQSLVKIITKTFGGLVKIISAPFVALWQVWDKYNITERLDEFATKAAAFFLPLVDAISEVDEVISDWFDTFVNSISDTIKALDPIETIVQVFTALKQLFRDLFDPTVTVSQAFSNFFDTMSTSNLAVIFEAIQSSFSNLWSTLKETAIGQWFEDLGTRIQNGAAAFAETSFGQKIIEISDALRDFLGIDTSDWSIFWEATKLMLTDVADAIGTGWEKIKTFFTELVNIVKGWFGFADGEDGSVDESIDDMVGTTDSSAMEDKIDVMEKTGGAIVSFVENTSKAVAMAEKLVPDPSESKFLTFMKELPEKIKEVGESISDGSIIEKIGNFFSSFFTSVKTFFSNISFGDGEDLLTWLADKVRVIASIVGDFLGIQIVDLADKGVFGVLGAMVSAIVGWFGDLDLNLLGTVDRIAKTVSRVLTAIISLKIVNSISYLANAAQAGAKGWQQQQAAKKLSALSDVLKSITLFIVGIGAVVFLLAYALDNEYIKPATLGWITGGVAALMFGLWLMVHSIEKSAKDIKPGSLTGIAKVLSNMGKMLIIVVLSVAALFGLAYFAYNIYMKAGIDITTFNTILTVITVAFVAIMVGSMVMVYKLQKWAGRMNAGSEVMTSISSVLKSVSGIFVSIIILLAGILASVAAFTYFIYIVRQNHAESELKQALVVVGILLVGAGLAIAGLIAIAKKMSSRISGVKPSDFKQIMMIMSGLLVTVMASIVILIMAVTAFVSMMTTTGASKEQMLTAFGMVAGLMIAVFGGLWLLFSSIKGISKLDAKGLRRAIYSVVTIMATLTIFVGLLVAEGVLLSGYVTDVKALWHTLGAMGAVLAGLILGIVAIGFIVKNNKVRAGETWKSLGVIAATMAMISVAVVGIAHTLKVLITAMASTGFLSQGGSITQIANALNAIVVGMLIAVTAISLLTRLSINTKNLVKVLGSLLVVAGSITLVAYGLSSLAGIDVGQLIAAGVVIGAITAVGLGLIAMLTVLAALLPGGAGMAALGIAAFAVLAFAGSMLALGYALKLGAESFDIFTNALNRLAKVNGSKIKRNIADIAQSIPDSIAVIAGGIVAANELIVGAGITLGTALATGVFTAINVFNTLIQGNIVAITTAISSVFIGVIEGNILALRDFIGILIKPGSALWDIIDMLCQFATVAAEYLGYYGFIVAVKFMEGIVHGIQDMGWDLKITEAINHIWTAIKQKVNEMFAWLDQKLNDFYAGANLMITDNKLEGYQEQLDDINAEIQSIGDPGGVAWGEGGWERYRQLVAAREDVLELMAQEQANRDAILNYNSDENERIQSELDAENAQLSDIASTVDDMIAEEARLRRIGNNAPDLSNYTGYTSYMPDQYRGLGMDVRREATEASSGISVLGTALQSLFGLSNGQSIGDTIRGYLGLSGDESIISSIAGALGLGNLSSLFGSTGVSSGASFADGFTTSLTTIDLSASLGNLIPDDVTNPVITPTVDTSGVSLGISNITDMFNNAHFDEFAIDAGNSMLLREAAEGDAATNGNVTYNFTQYNSSPEALSPIQIYRDTNNLFRAHVNS